MGGESKAFGLGLALGLVIGFVITSPLGLWRGYAKAESDFQSQAVEAGVGRWEIDARTGERQFVLFRKP